MILTLAWLASLGGCSDYGFGSNVDPEKGDSGAPPAADTAEPGPEPTTPSSATPEDPGLRGGHFDVDTTTAIGGNTEGHVHEYDDLHDLSGIDFVAPVDETGELQPLAEVIDDPDLEFVVVVANPDLSPAARLSIDGPYDPGDAGSWIPVGTYADIPLQELERHTLGTLPALEVHFAADAILSGGLVGTETTCVRRNDAGPQGEWRNGALVVQVIRADQLQTDVSASVGGVQGVATAGLLWEGVVFWHWPAACR